MSDDAGLASSWRCVAAVAGRTMTGFVTLPVYSEVLPSAARTRMRQVVVATPSTLTVVRHARIEPFEGKVPVTPSIVQDPPRPWIESGALWTAE